MYAMAFAAILLAACIYTVQVYNNQQVTMDYADQFTIHVSRAEHDSGRLNNKQLVRAGQILVKAGFVVLRGHSLFNESSLLAAQTRVERELKMLQRDAVNKGIQQTPWAYGKVGVASSKKFRFKQAYSYTNGRLDQPHLQHLAPFDALPWKNHPDFLWLCHAAVKAPCKQIITGAVWNFLGANNTYWHRDGELRAINVFVAAEDYPVNAGWPGVKPHSHTEGASSSKPLQVVLRKGEALVFMYRTKHAATPNKSDEERVIIYTAYSRHGIRDTENHKPKPSLSS